MGLVARGASLAQSYPEGSAGADRFTRWLSRYSEPRVVGALAATAALIRLYLVLTSYCISADGVAYIAMAREFHAGRAQTALAWVFSPLYPWLIAITYRAIPNWELAGELLSTAFGTAGVVLLYYLMREVYGRRGVAAGAAALAAIHPALAGFSASVRTEAGYIALVTAAVWFLVRGVERKRIASVAAAAMLCGLAYLYRTEGIGVPALGVIILTCGALVWRRWTLRWGLGAAAVLVAIFLLVAAPYLLWMRTYTGHWTVGRELGVVTMEATGSTMGELEQWREMGYRPATSWLTALRLDPSGLREESRTRFFRLVLRVRAGARPAALCRTDYRTVGRWQSDRCAMGRGDARRAGRHVLRGVRVDRHRATPDASRGAVYVRLGCDRAGRGGRMARCAPGADSLAARTDAGGPGGRGRDRDRAAAAHAVSARLRSARDALRRRRDRPARRRAARPWRGPTRGWLFTPMPGLSRCPPDLRGARTFAGGLRRIAWPIIS